MGNVGHTLESWFWMLKDSQMDRIKFLVVATTIFLLLMFFLDSYRYRSRRRAVKFVILVLDTVAQQIVTYTLGLMQLVEDNKDAENELIQVWAVLLVIIKGGIRYISAYSLEDKDERRRKEIGDLVDIFLLANVIFSRESSFRIPLWLLWSINLFRTLHGIRAFDLANRSYAHGKNAELVAGYMRAIHEKRDASVQENMSGYKYLVHGEAEQKVKLGMPTCHLELDDAHEKKLITIGKVRECKGKLLNSTEADHRVEKRRYICLSFALYKLLRRRFEGLSDDLLDKEREESNKMVTQLLKEADSKGSKMDASESLFRIIRKELGFLNDYLHTRFPIVFADGFPFVYVLYPIPLGVAAGWLAVKLITYSQSQSVDRNANRADIIITSVVTFSIIIKELLEMFTYIFSDWNKVWLLSKYVEKASLRGNRVVEKLIGFLCNYTLIFHWHDKIGQYQLLESFKYRPRLRNMLFHATLGMVERGEEGAKTMGEVTLTVEAKRAIVNSLRHMLNDGDHSLKGGVAALEMNRVARLKWACNLQTHAHTILVWHIATVLCEIHLSQHLPSIVTKKKFFFQSTRIQFSSPTTTPEKQGEMVKILRSRYAVATSLSQYCAYLLVAIPEFLPDYSITTARIFEKTVDEARENLAGYKDMQEMYERLMEMLKSNPSFGDESKSIIGPGARLAHELIEECRKKGQDEEDPLRSSYDDDTERRIESELMLWKILEEFWAEFILCLAPSDNTDVHQSHLNKGGEFMTHLWALLYHAGIVDPYTPGRPQDD